jgi:PGF-CTERM protein
MSRRPIDRTQFSAVILSTLLAASIVGAVALAPVAADSHTYDQAPMMTEEANLEISAVSQSDHHPGDQKTSMQYFAAGEAAFTEQGAEDGLFIDTIMVTSDWIDYSDCSVDNTATFGIDRGNNNSGTQTDEGLVQRRKDDDFRDDGLTVWFYSHEDLGGDPPYMAPEDAIVAQQGEGSAAGPCLQPTDEPGWYRIDGFLNGTVADNGRDQAPSDSADQVGVRTKSNWYYICDCESEEEARQQLGDPPSEGGSTATPESDDTTPTATDGGGGGGATATEAGGGGGGGGGATATEAGTGNGTGNGAGTGNGTGNGAGTGNGTGNGAGTGNGTGNDTGGFGGNDTGGTPTEDGGPGFGAIAALVALLGSALLLIRRR